MKGENMFICKNVTVNGRRTSMRLEKETWESLADICLREQTTIHKICSALDRTRGRFGLSSATRLFVLRYFRKKLNEYELIQYVFPRKDKHNMDI